MRQGACTHQADCVAAHAAVLLVQKQRLEQPSRTEAAVALQQLPLPAPTRAVRAAPPAVQDVLGTLEAWLTLMQTCHRHFRLRVSAVETLATHSVPLAVKRMTEDQLGQVSCHLIMMKDELLLLLVTESTWGGTFIWF